MFFLIETSVLRKSISPTNVSETNDRDSKTSPKSARKRYTIAAPQCNMFRKSIKPEPSTISDGENGLTAAKKPPKSTQLSENDSKVVSAPGKRSSNASFFSIETSSTDTPFEFATALDHVDISSYKSLVCMPPKLLSSNVRFRENYDVVIVVGLGVAIASSMHAIWKFHSKLGNRSILGGFGVIVGSSM